MSEKPLAWWVVPGIVTGALAALGALGTFIVKGAAYITLPERVEAGEQVDKRQDGAIDKLTGIQETWQKIYQQQAANAPPPRREPLRETDADGTWCCETTRERCWEEQTWERCE